MVCIHPARRIALALSLLALILLAGLGGCDLGPDYRRPGAEIPAGWRGSRTTAAEPWPSGAWWRGFRSPELNALIEEARARNFDITAAIARIRQADAEVRIAGAPLLPMIGETGTASYQRFGSGSGRSSNFSASSLSNLGAIGAGSSRNQYFDFHQYSAIGNASYEVDFWGHNAAALESAKASAMFSRYDAEVVALTVLTDVATTWFTALNLQDRLGIARRNVADAQQTLAVIQARLAAGTASALDVAQQSALVAGERATIPNFANQLEQEIIALGILVGRPPEAIRVHPGTLDKLALPAVYPGLPSALLGRRPDVAEAEAQLVAANADIKVARAAFFPTVPLTGSAGFENTAIATLFGPGATIISGTAALTQPIFDAGTLRGQLEQARGRYGELLADYRKSIVQAFTDVETALAAVRYTAKQVAAQEQAVATARRAADIARAQLGVGTVDVTTVLTIETTLYTDLDLLAQARLAQFLALLSLYKALGGGWTEPPGPIPAQFPGLRPGPIVGGFSLPVGDNLR